MKTHYLSSIAVSLLAMTASAQLPVTENFDYSPGSLGTANGGTGWLSPWGSTFTFATDSVSGSAPATVVSGNLDNAANPWSVTGNMISPASGVSYRKFDTAQHIAANGNETLYFSFMIQPLLTTMPTVFKFVESSISGAYNVFEFGGNASGSWTLGGAYGSGGGGSGTQTAPGSGTGAGAAFAINQSFFVVGKITTSSTANDQSWVQIYGDTGVVPTTDTLSTSYLLNWSVNRTDGRASNILLVNNNTANTSFVDGIRIGNSYLDVVAVPEPSTMALAGLGLAGLLIFRRRE